MSRLRKSGTSMASTDSIISKIFVELTEATELIELPDIETFQPFNLQPSTFQL